MFEETVKSEFSKIGDERLWLEKTYRTLNKRDKEKRTPALEWHIEQQNILNVFRDEADCQQTRIRLLSRDTRSNMKNKRE